MLNEKDIKIRAAELCIQAMLQDDTSIMDEPERLRLMAAMTEFLLDQIEKSRTRWAIAHERNVTLDSLKEANTRLVKKQ